MSQLKSKKARQLNKQQIKQRQRERKKKLKKFFGHALIVAMISAIIATVVPGIINSYSEKHNQAVQHNKQAYETVYLPISTQLLSAEKPIYLETYISVMQEHLAGREHLVNPQVLISLIQLMEKYKTYVVANELTMIPDKVKKEKKIELLVAAREYEARFNEQFQTVSEAYYSNLNISTDKQTKNLLVAKLNFREDNIFQFTTEIR